MKIGILGAGNVGRTIGKGLTGAGHRVLLGSRNRSHGGNANARFSISGQLLFLPAGPVTASLAMNGSRNRMKDWRQDSLNGPESRHSTSRERAEGQLNFSVPLSRRVNGEVFSLGDLSLNLYMGGQTETNSPVQKRYGGGVNWTPVQSLQLRGSMDQMEMAPTYDQLDGPVVTSITRIYDYTRQEMAEPIWITGGNPDLKRGHVRNLSLDATVRPFKSHVLTLNVGYRRRTAKGGVSSFPQLTPAIEAAFPGQIGRAHV